MRFATTPVVVAYPDAGDRSWNLNDAADVAMWMR